VEEDISRDVTTADLQAKVTQAELLFLKAKERQKTKRGSSIYQAKD
jgi:hypothetical protein